MKFWQGYTFVNFLLIKIALKYNLPDIYVSNLVQQKLVLLVHLRMILSRLSQTKTFILSKGCSLISHSETTFCIIASSLRAYTANDNACTKNCLATQD